ncbi:mitomycin radical oxidase [Verticillium alfalfae VaMs.102]|uniref:Mitomycin radical oxidase n=1 Tax=Verticillium alfalfae (strain VaMs.102 / ATCC MYA-4576 / FGSC 10136) TaxID=526221 RepID=C9SLZ8_VERA1|nr:mitomycin radical oxidase [Verticillium alfalfae VaMs.102]EEY19813.1 mitomycin radical oxidase [Verticillium alfalfae VaMs.102]
MAATTQQRIEFLSGLGLDSQQIESIQGREEAPGKFAEHVLTTIYPAAVDIPETPAYDEAIRGNWSALARKHPSIVFRPSSAEEVAKAVAILEFSNQRFAVRGGGHSPNPGWASIEQGVLISTDRLNGLQYDESSRIARIGAGNRWGMIYSYLEPYGVLVTGGHSSPVGCVGQITGCGNSPWFHKYGWSCDNVVNFEVVTTGGKIINANKDENEDLWWALKGGSNNFGIVTRLDMSTFPVSNGVWGGIIMHNWSRDSQRQWAEAFYKFQTDNLLEDSGVESLTGWTMTGGRKYLQTHGKFQPPRMLIADDVNKIRSSMLCLTVKANLEFYYEAVDIFHDAFKDISQVTNASATMNMSAISGQTMRESNQRGGNPPGWAEEDQCIVFLDNAWLHEKDTEYMLSAGKQCIAQLREAAQARGVLMPQIWMNNAGPDDDVIASYGKENWTKLRNISTKYDPKKTFQRLCAGGYKIEKT